MDKKSVMGCFTLHSAQITYVVKLPSVPLKVKSSWAISQSLPSISSHWPQKHLPRCWRGVHTTVFFSRQNTDNPESHQSEGGHRKTLGSQWLELEYVHSWCEGWCLQCESNSKVGLNLFLRLWVATLFNTKCKHNFNQKVCAIRDSKPEF